MRTISTNSIYKLIRNRLVTVCPRVYCETADSDCVYPYITYRYEQSIATDLHRDEVTFDIDIWDKGESAAVVENMADAIEILFNNVNIPQSDILPTFFVYDRKRLPDENKKIRHRLIRVLVQNYERIEV